MHRLNPSRYTVDMPVEDKNEELIALYQTMTGAFILIPERTWSYILSDPIAPVDPSTIDMLCNEGFLIREGVDERDLYENWKQQHAHDFSTLQSRILVTRKCNNRCRYCIIDPEAGEMSSETARAMDRFYINMIVEKNPERVVDTYLGGEPLLNSRIILESAARRYYYCLGREIPYSFSITTNGTLVCRETIRDMMHVGLTGIRVSMAGPAPVHDRLRPLKNNGKTYDLIMKNLKATSGLVPITIECQYDSGSLDFMKLPGMLDDFDAHKISVDSIAFTPILPQRGKDTYGNGMGDPGIFLYLKREAEKRGFPTNADPPTNSCMADFRSRLVFDTDGSLIPCPSVQGGEMAYGHVESGIDFISESQLLKRNLPEKCLDECELLPICMGGCRLQALTATNGFGGINCHYDTYRVLLEDYIKGQISEVSFQEEEEDLSEAA